MTQGLADEIRRLRAVGMLQEDISAKTGVSLAQVWRVINNKIWPHS